MTILKVYDTVLDARDEAQCEYELRKRLNPYIVMIYHSTHPYMIHDGNDIDIYVANKAEYVCGMRVDKIEDYTRKGLCDEIRACEYPLREG